LFARFLAGVIGAALVFSAHGAKNTESNDYLKFLEANKGKWWTCSPSEMARACGGFRCYRWNNRSKTQLRFYIKRRSGVITFNGKTLYEGLFNFKSGKLNRIYLSLYNRGDLTPGVPAPDFESLVKQAQTLVKEMTGKSPDSDKKYLGSARIYQDITQTDSALYILAWSYSRRKVNGDKKNQPEYLTLTISPKAENLRTAGAYAIKQSQDDLSGKVQKKANGNVYVEVPMVDQGAKGYCVAAVTERVMKYYGSQADQHMFAQIGDTSASKGTNIENMVKAMHRAGRKLNIRTKELYLNEDLSSASKFKKMLSKYNRSAKKSGKTRIKPKDYQIKTHGYTFYNYPAMMKAMDLNIYRKMRVEEYKSDFNHFKENVKKYVSQGIPVVWGVMLGIVKEPATPQMRGGHMRIIQGFNDKDESIIYSDSWGPKHAFKKLKWEDAWAMTLFLGVYLPKY
jgi:hypothetical protein